MVTGGDVEGEELTGGALETGGLDTPEETVLELPVCDPPEPGFCKLEELPLFSGFFPGETDVVLEAVTC